MSITASAASTQTTAAAGLQKAQAKLQGAAETIATRPPEPAVVVDVVNARTDFAANAAVVKTADDNTRRLLDELA